PSKITNLIGKIPLAGKYVKRVVDWVIKAGIEFTLSGAINCDIQWKRSKPDEEKFTDALGAGVTGALNGKLAVKGAALGSKVISVEIAATIGISVKAEPFIREAGFGAKVAAEHGGLKGKVVISLING